MKTLHLKSPCCQETIQRFGGKRRRCAKCGKTWTIRPRKRGPKPIRRFSNPVTEILLKGTTLTAWANRRGITVATASGQFHRHLEKFITTPLNLAMIMPTGPYILLVDALWFTFKKQDWTMFLLALKPVSEDKAYFLDPVLLAGGESYENWNAVLLTIPWGLKKQVKAMVSDGFRASRTITSEQGLVHQRCHFHLIAYLQVRRGRRKKDITGKSVREAIYQNVIKLLEIENQTDVRKLSARLKRLAKRSDCPKSLQMVVAEFLRSLPEFRAYLNYSELHLPTTTGSIETMCKLIRKRVAAVRTMKALVPWATALIRLKSPLTCNSKEHNLQQN